MKPIYSNQRSAPRMRKGEFSKMVVTKELHKRFLKEFPEYKGMSWNEFYNNWLDIAERVRYHTVYNPLGVKLGSYIGELKFQYLPYKFSATDYKTSEQEGEKKEFLNLTERGKIPTIKWERRWAVKFNKMLQFYAFDETREINKLSKEYASEFSEHIRVSRNTLGGHSVWRQKMKQNDQKTSN